MTDTTSAMREALEIARETIVRPHLFDKDSLRIVRDQIEAALTVPAQPAEPERKPINLLFTPEGLAKKIAADPDIENCEAGVLHPEAPRLRFFIEHDIIHDRATGLHFTTDDRQMEFHDLTLEAACDFLNSLAYSTPAQADIHATTDDELRHDIQVAVQEGLDGVRFPDMFDVERTEIVNGIVSNVLAAINDHSPTPPATEALKWLEENCFDLRCIEIKNIDDSDVGWEIVSHHMSKPAERVEGRGSSPAEALKEAGFVPTPPRVDEKEMRDEIAAVCIQWQMEFGGEYPIEGARRVLAEYRDAKHSGDCTKESHTCIRCQCDDAFKQTDRILAFGRALMEKCTP